MNTLYLVALLMTVQIDMFLQALTTSLSVEKLVYLHCQKIILAVQITFPLNKISTKIVYKLVFK